MTAAESKKITNLARTPNLNEVLERISIEADLGRDFLEINLFKVPNLNYVTQELELKGYVVTVKTDNGTWVTLKIDW